MATTGNRETESRHSAAGNTRPPSGASAETFLTQVDPAIAAQRIVRSLSVRPTDILALHRSIGNRAVQGLLARRADHFGPRDANGVAVSAESAVDRAASSVGEPLPGPVRSRFENSLGANLSEVRIHTGSESADAATAVGAKAYTVGQHIHFGAGEYAPGDPAGVHLLAHEVAHTVQNQSTVAQRLSRLQVSTPTDAAEVEADRIADAMIARDPSAADRDQMHARTPVLQREPAQTPEPAPGSGAKKWPLNENEWNTFYQLAIQGIAGGKLKPEQMPAVATTIADISMVHCIRHGDQLVCARNAVSDNDSRSSLDLGLTWGEGSKGVWGNTFRSALQSTTGGVDGPHTAEAAVQKASDIADQAARGFLGDALWKIYVNCKESATSSAAASS